jgi:hypothetical protein
MDSKINQKVVAWAHGKLRQQIGKGECWDLLDHALRFAGARSSTTTGPDDDYVWGTPIKLEDVVPGDILQLRNSIITTKTETLVRFPDGKGYRDTGEVFARRPHHGAIVEQVRGAGVFRVLEQHWRPVGKARDQGRARGGCADRRRRRRLCLRSSR